MFWKSMLKKKLRKGLGCFLISIKACEPSSLLSSVDHKNQKGNSLKHVFRVFSFCAVHQAMSIQQFRINPCVDTLLSFLHGVMSYSMLRPRENIPPPVLLPWRSQWTLPRPRPRPVVAEPGLGWAWCCLASGWGSCRRRQVSCCLLREAEVGVEAWEAMGFSWFLCCFHQQLQCLLPPLLQMATHTCPTFNTCG